MIIYINVYTPPNVVHNHIIRYTREFIYNFHVNGIISRLSFRPPSPWYVFGEIILSNRAKTIKSQLGPVKNVDDVPRTFRNHTVQRTIINNNNTRARRSINILIVRKEMNVIFCLPLLVQYVKKKRIMKNKLGWVGWYYNMLFWVLCIILKPRRRKNIAEKIICKMYMRRLKNKITRVMYIYVQVYTSLLL